MFVSSDRYNFLVNYHWKVHNKCVDMFVSFIGCCYCSFPFIVFIIERQNWVTKHNFRKVAVDLFWIWTNIVEFYMCSFNFDIFMQGN